ncbi:MAG: glycosyltransferase [Actinomycetota bacterium]|nr:glycosyltransferase [Actinomycetota bacterium]
MATMPRLLVRARRRAGRVKRWVKRRIHERNVGRQYAAWLGQATSVYPGTTSYLTTISILVPVFDPPPAFLRQCLQSVVSQQARNWQLVVVDDGSTKPGVTSYLAEFSREHDGDERVVVVSQANGGISSALNRALSLATGRYVGVLDHDDLLDPRCIDSFAHALEDNAFPDAVYSDEDKVTARGDHLELYCKPDFSPELLLTQMYLCHFTVFRLDQVRELGGFRSEMDGAQDFDLALRLLPRLGRVAHIPHPLYHWRTWAESTARSIDAKPWAQEAAARAQLDHLTRSFGGGVVGPSSIPGLNEVHPRVGGDPVVSVIIPTVGTRNPNGSGRFVDAAVHSLLERETSATLEIIVVTTGVIPDVPVDLHGKHTVRHVVYDTQAFNFSEAINTGRAAATGHFLLLLNDDTTVAGPNPVTRLLEVGQIDGVGIAGCRLTYPDGRLQHAGMILLPDGPTHCWIGRPGKEPGYFGSTLTPRNYLAVTAAAMLVRADVFDELDGFDPLFARDFNDVDFCLRAHDRGHRVAWTPYAHFTHHEGATMARRKPDPAEAELFRSRWAQVFPVDPYYSPALHQSLPRLYEAL